MSPETMISSGYTETSPKVIDNRPNEGLSVQRSVKRGPDTKHWHKDDECDIEFMQMLPPIGHSDGLFIRQLAS